MIVQELSHLCLGRGCTPRTKPCFTKKVVKKETKQKVKIVKEEENAILYVAFTLIIVQQRLVRKMKEKGDKRFYDDNTKR